MRPPEGFVDILGFCAFDRAAAACLVRDGRILAAAREDVFSGTADDPSFPANAIAFCLRAGKVGPTSLGAVAFAGTVDARASGPAYSEGRGGVSLLTRRVLRWLGRGGTVRDAVARELDPAVPVESFDARLAEAAASYFTAPFADADVLVLEEGGAAHATAVGGEIGPFAPLSTPAGITSGVESVLAKSGLAAVCLAGALARDRAANGGLLARASARVWMHPATGAGAAALGAALLAARRAGDRADGAALKGGSAALGPSYNAAQIRTFLRSQGLAREESGRDIAPALAAAALVEGSRVLWFDGRLDFDDDAAGSRSILRAPSPASPPDTAIGEVLAVAAERVPELFDVDGPCPPLVALRARPAARATVGLPDRDAACPVAPILPDHRGFRALLAAHESATGCPAVVARALRRRTGTIAAAPHDAWDAREIAGASRIVLGTYVLDEASLADSPSPASAPRTA